MKTVLAIFVSFAGISGAIAADKCDGIVRCTIQNEVKDANGEYCDGFVVVGYAVGLHGISKTFMASCHDGYGHLRASAEHDLQQLQKDGVCERE